MIVSEQQYLSKNYFHLVDGWKILRYQGILNSTHKNNEFKENFRRRIVDPLIKNGAYSQEELNEFLSLIPADLERKLTDQLLEKYLHKIYFNRCPACQALARTPYAKQCPNCVLRWEHCKKARFKILDYERVAETRMQINGKVLEGELIQGMSLDLLEYDLGIYPKITKIDIQPKLPYLLVEFKQSRFLDEFEQVNFMNREVSLEKKDT